ncbi:hypothetical protein DSM112329_01937 [Paraconexibacter sp. AEG42_29]|uniref:Fenitrothion hydrolase n=1 Tax=Paraconexibacter sp. AEG42_29 TaxID=2997339 RepID=A0AAU7AUR6_9ACTN
MAATVAKASAGLLGLALALPSGAEAHATELVGTQTLAIPRWMFFVGAAIVLVISFAALGKLWSRPKLAVAAQRTVLRVPRWLDPLCGGVGVAGFAGLVYAGLAGDQDPAQNILPTAVFVAFWIGVPILTLLFGDVFRPFNPWRAIGRGTGWLVGRVGGDLAAVEPLRYPRSYGYLPAAAGLMTFVFFELAYTDRNEPATLAVLVLMYAAVQLIGMACFGVQVWTDRADAFAVYFRLFASLSPLHWAGRELQLRVPLSGTAKLADVPGTVVLLCVMIGSTSFDGFTVSRLWNTIAKDVLRVYNDAGIAAVQAGELTFATGLVVVVLIIGALYRLGVQGMRRRDREHSAAELALRFAPSLVPIALAYVLAHYFGLLTYQGQTLIALVSDPLGHGSDLFGTADRSVDYELVSATAIWYVQVLVLLVGHGAGLAVAHDRALTIYATPAAAARSQRWMLGVMVLFTLLALWLLSALA